MQIDEDSGLDPDQVECVWVDLELRHDRLFGTVRGTGLVVSARSIATLKSRVVEALNVHYAGEFFIDPRVYWLSEGRQVLFPADADKWRVPRRPKTDHDVDDLRSQAQ